MGSDPAGTGLRLNEICQADLIAPNPGAMLTRDTVDLHALAADLTRNIDHMLMVREVDRLCCLCDEPEGGGLGAHPDPL